MESRADPACGTQVTMDQPAKPVAHRWIYSPGGASKSEWKNGEPSERDLRAGLEAGRQVEYAWTNAELAAAGGSEALLEASQDLLATCDVLKAIFYSDEASVTALHVDELAEKMTAIQRAISLCVTGLQPKDSDAAARAQDKAFMSHVNRAGGFHKLKSDPAELKSYFDLGVSYGQKRFMATR